MGRDENALGVILSACLILSSEKALPVISAFVKSLVRATLFEGIVGGRLRKCRAHASRGLDSAPRVCQRASIFPRRLPRPPYFRRSFFVPDAISGTPACAPPHGSQNALGAGSGAGWEGGGGGGRSLQLCRPVCGAIGTMTCPPSRPRYTSVPPSPCPLLPRHSVTHQLLRSVASRRPYGSNANRRPSALRCTFGGRADETRGKVHVAARPRIYFRTQRYTGALFRETRAAETASAVDEDVSHEPPKAWQREMRSRFSRTSLIRFRRDPPS
ncbi:unnamed protein product, partial [Iphiclides podalirius]